MISPFAASIAAGNCSILITVINDKSAISALLEELVFNLDNDAYATIELPSSEHIHKITGPSIQCLVLQSSYPLISENHNSTKILRPMAGRAFAVIDRSCTNLKSAASELAQIKFLNGGTSPFAPTFVLVHEIINAEFLREFLIAIKKYFPENIAVNGKDEFERLSDVQTRLTSSKSGYGRVVMSGNICSAAAVPLEVSPIVIDGDRRCGSELCEMAKNVPILPIFSVRSLDDAIDYASNMYIFYKGD
jgi:aldehyde dehydrogenase (NAD+)